MEFDGEDMVKVLSDTDESKVEMLKDKVKRKIVEVKEIQETIGQHHEFITNKDEEIKRLHEEIEIARNKIDENRSAVRESDRRRSFLNKDLSSHKNELDKLKSDLIDEILK